jgi:aspartyl-tRNA(Asn)/glutamyl-tRNA(Gln) amidotransferase subunit A
MIAGQVRNPWNRLHVPGGSSGGSAAAVALDLCEGALGTDTGGSVRVPAAYCGVTGLRPTHGRVPNRGALAVSASFDTIGPLARSVEDVARLFVAIAGFDAADPTSVDVPLDASVLTGPAELSGVRIGVPRSFYFDNVDPEIARAVCQVARTLDEAGAQVVEVEVADAEVAHRFATTIILADACEIHAAALDERRDAFSPQVYERMTKGRAHTAVDYARAQRFREAWRATLRELFSRVDILLFPATPYPAPPIEDGAHLEEATRHATRFSYGGGLAGLPGLALPCGFTGGGLPIGVLLEAAWYNEALLLRAGRAWQRTTDWHLRRPGSV